MNRPSLRDPCGRGAHPGGMPGRRREPFAARAPQPSHSRPSRRAPRAAAGARPDLRLDLTIDEGLLARVCEAGTISRVDRPGVSAAVVPQRGHRRSHERASTSTSPRKSSERLGVEVEFTDPAFEAVVAGSGSDAMGHERRLHHRHRSSARRSSTSPSRTTTRRPRWPSSRTPISRASTTSPARWRRRRGDHLPLLDRRHAQPAGGLRGADSATAA